MNKRLLVGLLISTMIGRGLVMAQVKVNPLNWWVGMKTPDLQLMVYAPAVGKTSVKLKPYAGVRLKQVHTVENDNYLFIDLVIAPTAKPGSLHVEFTGSRHYTMDYELKQKDPRDGTTRIQGVTSKDLVYMLMPDRFSNGDVSNDVVKVLRDTVCNPDSMWLRHGGDIRGVQNHLDYLSDLGATAVWLTPVIENDMPISHDDKGNRHADYHGYSFTDQYQVDRRFGGNKAYTELIETAHKKGLKIIQDAVYNHVGLYHWTVQDLPMKDWLNQWPSYTNTSYKDQAVYDPHGSVIDKRLAIEGWFTPMMPDMNQKNPYVRNYLLQYAIWATEFFGVDGWRVDTYFYSDPVFLNAVNAALEKEFPHITVFGETWVNTVTSAAYLSQNNLDVPFKHNLQGVVDFPLFFAMLDGLNQPYGWNDGVNKVYTTLAQDLLYKNPYRNCIMLDNHDLDRIFSVVGERMDKFKMGIGWLMTLRGIPQLYYGTEILMKNFKNPTDAMVRMDFPGGWPGDTINKFVPSGRTAQENEAFNYIRTLAQYRKKTTALTTGKLMQFAPDNGVYVYFRYDDQKTIMVVSNTSDQEQPMKMDHFAERTKGFSKGTDVVSGATQVLGDWKVPAKATWILELKQ